MKLEKNDRKAYKIQYASAIGNLMYEVLFTRTDATFVVSKLSKFTSNSSEKHQKAIGRAHGHLNKTKNLGP